MLFWNARPLPVVGFDRLGEGLDQVTSMPILQHLPALFRMGQKPRLHHDRGHQGTSKDAKVGLFDTAIRRIDGLDEMSLDDAGEQAGQLVMLCSMDVRRHVRRLLESEFPELPVISFQELAADLNVRPVAQIQGASGQQANTGTSG